MTGHERGNDQDAGRRMAVPADPSLEALRAVNPHNKADSEMMAQRFRLLRQQILESPVAVPHVRDALSLRPRRRQRIRER